MAWLQRSVPSQGHGQLSLRSGAATASGYWRTLIGQIKDLKLLSAIELRLSAFLLALAPRETGPVTVTPGGRRLVAGRLGITPQSLSRFAALRPLGISGGGRQVTIVDPARLREFAGARALKGPDGGA